METDLYVQSLIDESDALIEMHTASIKLLDDDCPVADWHREKIKTNLRMKTLLDRLRPDIMKKLTDDAENYPASTRRTIEELRENVSFLYLTVDTATSLCSMDNKNLGINNLKDLFS